MLLDKRLTLLRGQWMDAARGAISFKHCWKNCQKKVARLILKTRGIREILKNQPLSFSASRKKGGSFCPPRGSRIPDGSTVSFSSELR